MKALIDAMFVADTVSSVIHIYQGFRYARMGAKALARAGARAGSQTSWPPNRGFASAPVKQTLKSGTRIDRYGYEGGSFLSPEGTPYGARSLAPGSANKPYNVYEVLKPFNVDAGKAAPWFGELGGGAVHNLICSM